MTTLNTPRYYSTRDEQKRLLSFEDALLAGLAPDGGLYLPDQIPQLAPDSWLAAASFNDLALQVMSAWLGQEISREDLQELLAEALNFPLPLVDLGDGIKVLELFHGPTLSFKDFGARTMARLMSRFLVRRKEQVTILVATSGDTGSAVVDGFAGQPNIEVVLLYPQGMVSPVQERQLIVKRPGVRSFAVRGSFDDCQRLVKEAFVDKQLADLQLSSANSINIGRLLPQSLYYFWAKRQVAAEYGPAQKINFCVPSGNLGNLTAGVLASLMSLEVGCFLAAHNANDFFPNYLHKLARAYDFKPTVATISNAMDVGAPSNFERLHNLLAPERLTELIWGSSVSDEITRTRMKRVYQESGYVACPHTAVGLEAVARYRRETGDDSPIITLATAHPAKFPSVVEQALGTAAPQVERLELLKQQETAVTSLKASIAALRSELLGG